MKTFFKKIFGSRNQRLLNDYSKIVSKINALEPEMQRCSDEELRKKTEQFQSELLKKFKFKQVALMQNMGIFVQGS